MFLLGEHGGSSETGGSRTLATPVVAPLHSGGPQDIVFGNAAGEVVALPSGGQPTVVARVRGPVDASVMVADVDGDGVYEVLVSAADGIVTCFTTGTRDLPRDRSIPWRLTDERGRDEDDESSLDPRSRSEWRRSDVLMVLLLPETTMTGLPAPDSRGRHPPQILTAKSEMDPLRRPTSADARSELSTTQHASPAF